MVWREGEGGLKGWWRLGGNGREWWTDEEVGDEVFVGDGVRGNLLIPTELVTKLHH